MAHFTQQFLRGAAFGALAIAIHGTAIAQDTSADDQSAKDSDIVVTGTLIKGVDPVGTNVIGVTEADVEEIGATNGTDLLRRIPQVGDFNSVPQPTTDASIPFAPIQLRGIGGLSGMATLILLDGKRIVPTSPGMNWIDTQMIPAGIIERVEVIPDGGSSIYGSDAIGGVVNFVTKRNFDGVAVDANYGLGKGDYSFYDATITGGQSWDSGSAVLSYSYSAKDALFGRDLGYLIEDKTALGGADNRSISCAPGTITANGTSYALPSRTAGTTNYCSSIGDLSFYPKERRHSIFGTLTQTLWDGAELSVNGYWSQRKATIFDPDNARSSGTITSTNPYFSAVAGETSQDVAFSYGDARGNPSKYEAWQVSPTLNMDFAPGWSAQIGFNYGKSDSIFTTNRVNSAAQVAALAGTTNATALNPYNPSASNAAILAGIFDFTEVESSHQELLEGRFVLNGTFFPLPGGDIRVAAGSEMRKEVFNRFRAQGASASQTIITNLESDRDVVSLFGEVYLPLFTGFEASVSARYDHYSDVGSTTNPKIGFTYEPVEGIKLRGSWGTAFHAPALADLTAPLGYEFFLPISPFREANSPFFPDFFKPSFLLTGASPDIKPEEAETWSVGFDVTPADGLKIGATYWNIVFENRIDQNAGFFFGPGYYADPANADYFILNPATPADVIAQFGNFPVLGFPDLQTMFNIFGAPYVVSDQRKQNLGTLKIDGLDFNASYSTGLAGGTIDLGINGTYMLNRDKENVLGAGFSDTLKFGDFNSPISRMNATANLGWGKGPIYASTTLYYRSKAEVGSEDIDAFTTMSLFGKYDVTDFLTFSVNVDNAFDSKPPLRPTVTNGRAYIDQGRTFKFGIGAKF